MIGICRLKPPPAMERRASTRDVVQKLSNAAAALQQQQEETTATIDKKMKGLFKSKPRTPAKIVIQTRDLLVYADRPPKDTLKSKREEKTVELYKNIRDLKVIFYGNSESEQVAEACAKFNLNFFFYAGAEAEQAEGSCRSKV